MTQPAADTSAVLTAQDALVLASMDSAVETQLVMDWLDRQRARNPGAKFDVLKLPSASAEAVAAARRAARGRAKTVRLCRCGCSGCRPRIAADSPSWSGCCRAEIPTTPTNVSSARSCATIPAAPGWWPARRPRYPNSASSGATPPSARTSAISPSSSRAAPSWRWSVPSTASSDRSTSRRGW